jgi:pimeloyl-ACP methyl ester carboxylesterase
MISCINEDSSALILENCYIEELDETVICGSYVVMENHNVTKGRKIRLNFIILPAKIANPEPDPIFCFSGGPGVGTAASVAMWAPYLHKLRLERDIVLLDQRGTGKSNPLPCELIGNKEKAQTYLQESWPVEYVKKCKKDQEADNNLRYYHSSMAAIDIDELRKALGYNQINIWGISYGGYLAIVYMKSFPDSIRSAFLESPANPYYRFPSTMAQDLQEALDKMIADCAADPDCSSDYPNLEEELYAVLYRLQQNPITVNITNPVTNQMEQVIIRDHIYIRGLRSLMLSSYGQSWIPCFIHWTYRNFYSPLVQVLLDRYYGASTTYMDGMYLCVACTDTVPFIDFYKATSEAQGTFMGTYALHQIKRACDFWVSGIIPERFHDLPTANIPTLIITGDLDPAVRPYEGEILLTSLPNSFHYTIPNNSHGVQSEVWFECIENEICRFFSQGSVSGLDFSCVDNNQRPPWISWRDFTTEKLKKISKKIKLFIPKHR